eukprot:TRINITY_DN5018_c0_g1_i2.p1 TRINITY_DN5018_c0_g1~~TRINITY_DN5018_c0_g1_i2.p1  ORF type:complete len:654 (-),score=120.41 TRINITY_DN5018_c0_g1_i2:55-2016(-)
MLRLSPTGAVALSTSTATATTTTWKMKMVVVSLLLIVFISMIWYLALLPSIAGETPVLGETGGADGQTGDDGDNATGDEHQTEQEDDDPTAAAPPHFDPRTVRPNVLVIVVDDLGYHDLAFTGNQYFKTPHLDQLAKESLRFDNAYATSHVCAPARASFLSGQYGPRHGLYTIGNEHAPHSGQSSQRKYFAAPSITYLPAESITIAEALKAASSNEKSSANKGATNNTTAASRYRTALIGKWHLGMDNGQTPEGQGFDLDVGSRATGATNSHFFPYGPLTNLERGRPGEYLANRLTTEAIHWILGLPRPKLNQEAINMTKAKDELPADPFFMFLSYYAVHTPIQAPEEHTSKYLKDGAYINTKYAGMVDNMDHNVGRLMSVLRSTGLESNTVVVFMSDNGGLLGITNNAPLRGGKGMLFEGGVRVPMTIKWKDVIKPRVCHSPVITVDLYPTILQLARRNPPIDYILDGVSLVTLLLEGSKSPVAQSYNIPAKETTSGQKREQDTQPEQKPTTSGSDRQSSNNSSDSNDSSKTLAEPASMLLNEADLETRPIFWHFPEYMIAPYYGIPGVWSQTPASSIRLGHWKLYHNVDDDSTYLYNVTADVSERRDLATQEPKVVRQLRARLDSWLADTKAYVPHQLNPDWDGVLRMPLV